MAQADAALRRAAHIAFERRDAARLERLCSAVLAQRPQDSEVRRLMGRAALREHRPASAEPWLREAAARAPDDPAAWLDLAQCLVALRRDHEAEAMLTAVDARGVRSAAMSSFLGFLRGGMGRKEDAREAFETALDADSTWAPAYRGLAWTEGLVRGETLHAQAEALGSANATPPTSRAAVLYALAEAARQAGDDDAFFIHLVNANRVQRSLWSQRKDGQRAIYKRVRKLMGKQAMASAKRARPAPFTPVFIAGLPCAGASLVERIIGAHPDVAAGDAPGYLTGPVVSAFEARTQRSFPEGFERLSGNDYESIADEYVSRVRELAPGAHAFTDKDPSGFRLQGLIALTLPNAKVIHIRRDPMDQGFAAFRHPSPQAAPYTCDLAAIGGHFKRYAKLAEHFAATLPQPALDVRYEQLIHDPETHIRRMLKHCDLDFDEACLRFYEAGASSGVMTARAASRPVDSDRVGVWLEFKRQLAPLRQALGSAYDDYWAEIGEAAPT